MNPEQWATDTLISFPEPPAAEAPVLVGFDGFGFSMNGMVHDLSQADVEEMISPTFAPEGYRGRDDLGPMGGFDDVEAR